MKRKNRYCHHSHLSEWKFREIIRYFSLDIEASKIAILSGVSRNTVNKILTALRIRMVESCVKEFPLPNSSDEFSDTCARENHFKESGTKVTFRNRKKSELPILEIIKCNGKIFTQVMPDISKKSLKNIELGKETSGNTVNGNDSSHYFFLDLKSKKLYRMNHPNEKYSHNRPMPDTIEHFWGIAKMRLFKFRGMNRNTIFLHLKESEFRFNHRHEDLYKLFLQILRKEPLRLDGSSSRKDPGRVREPEPLKKVVNL